jgi:RimJ/RimL family protein N-acetyltransferase
VDNREGIHHISDYFWQGDKVRLRPVRRDDWEMWLAESTDTQGIRLMNLGVELPASAETAQSFAERYADCKDPDGFIIFSVETPAGALVGGVTLHSRDEKNGRFSFGVRIYRPFRGRGYATEAVRILLRYGFHERRYQKANSACLEINEESIRLHRRLGFKEEGRRRRHVYTDGRYYDDLLFGLTREEFDEMERDR